MVTTQLVAIGDLHLQDDADQAERLATLDAILDHGGQLPALGGWLVVGDVFHARSKVSDRNAFAARLVRMANRGPVLVCRGNHDEPGELAIFGQLAAGYPITVLDERPGCVRLRLATGQALTAFGLPYPSKGALVAAGLTPGDGVQQTADELLDRIFAGAAVELEMARAQGDLTLHLAHANIVGAQASTGNPQIGMEISVSERHLARLGDIPKIYGHIHLPQDLAGATFVGSATRLSWAETERKRFLVVEFAPDRSYHYVSVPLDVAPRWHVEGRLTREAFTWQVTDGPSGAAQPAPTSWKGARVRVRYTFNQSEKSILDEARVLAEFAEAAKLVLEPIAVPDRALRAPAVVEATTLAAKVEAWAGVAGVTTTEPLMDKLAALEHTDPTVLVAETQAWLATIETPETAQEAA